MVAVESFVDMLNRSLIADDFVQIKVAVVANVVVAVAAADAVGRVVVLFLELAVELWKKIKNLYGFFSLEAFVIMSQSVRKF